MITTHNRASSGSIKRDLQRSSTVLCTKCVTIDLDLSTQKPVSSQFVLMHGSLNREPLSCRLSETFFALASLDLKRKHGNFRKFWVLSKHFKMKTISIQQYLYYYGILLLNALICHLWAVCKSGIIHSHFLTSANYSVVSHQWLYVLHLSL